ncbi:hypothetical protein HanIR_Chr14g0707081 [Helianthus annuus]|nr:hypothetical protein HanIR_Chr14g0707081 [Helianthus annuus]
MMRVQVQVRMKMMKQQRGDFLTWRTIQISRKVKVKVQVQVKVTMKKK